MEGSSRVQELLAQARQKEEEARQVRATQAQAEVDAEAEQITDERREQTRRHAKIEELKQQIKTGRETITAHQQAFEAVKRQQQEVVDKIKNPDTPDEARELYRQALDALMGEEQQLYTAVADIQQKDAEHEQDIAQHEGFIEATGKKAAARIDHGEFAAVAEYVRQMRKLREERPQLKESFDIEKAVTFLLGDAKRRRQDERRGIYHSGGEGVIDSRSDVFFDRLSDRDGTLQRFFSNPLLVQELRAAIQRGIDERIKGAADNPGDAALSKDADDAAAFFRQRAFARYADRQRNDYQTVEFWTGGESEHETVDGAYIYKGIRPYNVDAAKGPALPERLHMTPEQLAQIQTAVEDTSISLDDLKRDLGFQRREGVTDRIYDDAKREDTARALEEPIKELNRDIANRERDLNRWREEDRVAFSKLYQLYKNARALWKEANDYVDTIRPQEGMGEKDGKKDDFEAGPWLTRELQRLRQELDEVEGRRTFLGFGEKGKQARKLELEKEIRRRESQQSHLSDLRRQASAHDMAYQSELRKWERGGVDLDLLRAGRVEELKSSRVREAETRLAEKRGELDKLESQLAALRTI